MKINLVPVYILLAVFSVKADHSLYECQIPQTTTDEHTGQTTTYNKKSAVEVKCNTGFFRVDEDSKDYESKKNYCQSQGGKFVRSCECKYLSASCPNASSK